MKTSMFNKSSAPMRRSLVPTVVALLGLSCATSVCSATLNGQLLGGGAPIANSTVMLWAANVGAPNQFHARWAPGSRSNLVGSFNNVGIVFVAANFNWKF